jgi:hypothetical protein
MNRRITDNEDYVTEHPSCKEVIALTEQMPTLSKNVLVIDTKMTIGIALLSVIAMLLTTQSLYQIPRLEKMMNQQDSILELKISNHVAEDTTGTENINARLSRLESDSYVVRADIKQSRVSERNNRAAIRKNTKELNRPKNFFGR